MENDNFHDRSVIGGLTIPELDEYSNRNYVPEQTREARVGLLSPEQKNELIYGMSASRATSMFMLLSVHVKPRESSSPLLSVYGEITSFSGCFPCESDYLYKRESQDVERFSGSDGGGYLTLNGPSRSCSPHDAGFLFKSRELSVRLYDQHGQRLYPLVDDDDDDDDGDPIILDYSSDDFEQVKEMVVQNSEISLTFKYVSIPMAVYGCLHFSIFKRKGYGNVSKFVDVRGKVVAKYKSTFGNCKSEEIVLFDKNPEYERVVLDTGYNNLLSSSRCWMVAPGHSLLQLRIELFDGQQRTCLTEDVELETANCSRSSTKLVFGQYFLDVCAAWFSAPSQLPEQDGCYNQISRTLKACTSQLSPSAAIEVFSCLVGYEDEGCKRLRIHGRLQFSFGRSREFYDEGVDIFKQEKEDHWKIVGRGGAIPVLDGSRFLDFFFPLTVVCDLKDTKRGLNIKGYQILNDLGCIETELCSIFRGDHGFAALHYAIFPSAVQVDVKVLVYKQQALPRTVSGSICARYGGFDYSSKYKKKWYRIVLFRGLMRPCTLPSFEIPLFRSSFVVPSYSSAVFDLNLMIGTQRITDQIEVAIDTKTRSIQGEGCELKFMLEWSKVK